MPSDIKNSNASMARIGQILKEAREKKPFTIDQVQKQTRIHITVLKALEEGRCDEILTPTYVRSFLKKYAEYLGLDSRSVLGEYAKMNPAKPAQNVAVKSAIEPARPIDLSITFPVIKAAAIGIIIIAIIAVAAGGMINAFKALGKARASSKVKPAATVIRPAAATAKKKAAAKPAAQKDIPTKSDSPAKPAAPLAQQSAAPAVISKSTPIKLILRVNRQTMIKLRVDGNLIFERVLSPGTVESFTANDRINIYTAKAEAIELFLNGRSLGSPGKGIMKNIEITRSGLKIK